MIAIKRYLWNVWIGVDQFVNAILGGDPDETISSRLGKKQHRCMVCRAICWLLSRIDGNHCRDAIEHDEGEKYHGG